MLLYEYKLRLSPAQQAAIDEAIRTTQFIRNKALRLWMEGRGVTPTTCNSSAPVWRRTSFCRPLELASPPGGRLPCLDCHRALLHQLPGEAAGQEGLSALPTGLPLGGVQADRMAARRCREAPHLHRWRWHRAGTAHWLTGASHLPREQIKRVRLLRRADGYYAQFVLQVERRISHAPTGSAVGIDVGIAAYVTDSDGQRWPTRASSAWPRRASSAVSAACPVAASTTSVGRSPGTTTRRVSGRATTSTRQRVQRPQRDSFTAAPPAPSAASSTRQSANWGKAKQQVGRAYLTLQRQREDFARKTASALISSHDLIALEDLKVRNLVRNRRLSQAISDVSWSRLRRGVEDYGRLQEVAVVAVPPAYTTQDWSGVLPDGTPCPARIRKSLSMRTHICPRCGLILDRDENAAVNILACGLALARAEGRWPPEASEMSEPSETSEPSEPSELSEPSGTVGHTGT